MVGIGAFWIFCIRAIGRAVAQSGSALRWGCRGREFKSRRPDQFSFFNEYKTKDWMDRSGRDGFPYGLQSVKGRV